MRSMCTLLEISVEDHSAYINEWLIEAQWSSVYGKDISSYRFIKIVNNKRVKL